MSILAAYILAKRVEQLTAELAASKETDTLNKERFKHLEWERNELAGEVNRKQKEVDAAGTRAIVAERLNRSYSLFCDNVGVQIGNYGLVGKDLFSFGRAYVESNGKDGREFEPDCIPATDRAERAHKRKLIRQLAERNGVKLLATSKKK